MVVVAVTTSVIIVAVTFFPVFAATGVLVVMVFVFAVMVASLIAALMFFRFFAFLAFFTIAGFRTSVVIAAVKNIEMLFGHLADFLDGLFACDGLGLCGGAGNKCQQNSKNSVLFHGKEVLMNMHFPICAESWKKGTLSDKF